MVHNHKWQHIFSVDSDLFVRPGFSVSHTMQMDPHSPGNLQRGHILVPRVVQNCLSGLQSRTLRGSADYRIKWIIQTILPLLFNLERKKLIIIGNYILHYAIYI